MTTKAEDEDRDLIERISKLPPKRLEVVRHEAAALSRTRTALEELSASFADLLEKPPKKAKGETTRAFRERVDAHRANVVKQAFPGLFFDRVPIGDLILLAARHGIRLELREEQRGLPDDED